MILFEEERVRESLFTFSQYTHAKENTTFTITEKKLIEEKIKNFNINYGNQQCTKAGSIEEPCGYQVKMFPEKEDFT